MWLEVSFIQQSRDGGVWLEVSMEAGWRAAEGVGMVVGLPVKCKSAHLQPGMVGEGRGTQGWRYMKGILRCEENGEALEKVGFMAIT